MERYITIFLNELCNYLTRSDTKSKPYDPKAPTFVIEDHLDKKFITNAPLPQSTNNCLLRGVSWFFKITIGGIIESHYDRKVMDETRHINDEINNKFFYKIKKFTESTKDYNKNTYINEMNWLSHKRQKEEATLTRFREKVRPTVWFKGVFDERAFKQFEATQTPYFTETSDLKSAKEMYVETDPFKTMKKVNKINERMMKAVHEINERMLKEERLKKKAKKRQ